MTDSSGFLTILWKSCLAVLLACAALYLCGELFAQYAPWRQHMDPRQRMVWDGKYDGSRYVMIGDSAFCSYYVDRPEETIWARLQQAVGEKVYPGALDGSKPSDFLRQADLISSSWPAGTTVFLNIIPTRFVQSAVPEPEDGNYRHAFRDLPEQHERLDLKNVLNVLKYYLGEISFFFRQEGALKATVDALGERPVFFNKGSLYNRNWTTESDGFALNRYRTFENNVVLTQRHKSMEWLTTLRDKLSQRDMKLVVVMTPLNKPLIRNFAKNQPAGSIVNYLDSVHAAVLDHLVANKIQYVDLYSAADAGDFADMLHTNERGDEVIVKSLARWIEDSRKTRANRARVHPPPCPLPSREWEKIPESPLLIQPGYHRSCACVVNQPFHNRRRMCYRKAPSLLCSKDLDRPVTVLPGQPLKRATDEARHAADREKVEQ